MPVVPVVAIELPAEVAPDLASVVIRTCNLALGSGRCVLVDSAQPAPNTNWLAHVGADPTQTSLLRIELRDALPRETRTTYSRALGFEDSDAPTQRWSTVGVVVAALVISAETGKGAVTASGTVRVTDEGARVQSNNESENGTSVTAPPQTKSKSTSPNRARTAQTRPVEAISDQQRRLAVRLDLSGMAGPGIEGHSARYGMLLRPSIELTQNLGLWIQAAGSRADDSVNVSWWAGTAGVGFVADIVPNRFAMEARIGIIGDRIAFDVTDAAGNSDSAVRWRYGAGAGLDAVVTLADSFCLFVGADGAWLNPRVRIRLAGNDVGRSPTIDALFSAGLRWRIPFGR